MAKAKFKKGDRVRISKNSEYYEDSLDSNPADVTGTVTSYKSVKHNDEFSTYVSWDNGENNTYSDYDLELYKESKEAVRAEEFTVDKEFVMQAYEAACSTWKERIEDKFPDLFPKSKYVQIVEDEDNVSGSSIYYMTRQGVYKHLRGVSLILGVAGYGNTPAESKYRGLYIDSQDIKPVITETDGGAPIVLFEKQ